MTQPDPTGAGLSEVADADLVLRTRSGGSDAFGELWRRHYRSGLTVARSVTSSLDPDDLVQEAYARIYQSIQKGGGPTGSFRAYLFTSIRNTAAGWGRARKESNIDEFEEVEDPRSNEQATEEALDRSLTHRAFQSLPTRWQEVLWYTEIEQMKPAEIAPLLGMKATAVAQLSFRAREGLREAWIQAHLQSVQDGSEHQWTIERLGAYARNNLGARDRTRLEAHLEGCARCTIVAGEAHAVGSRLALVLLPLALGSVGAAGYLAALQGGGVPLTVAIAAMPSAVTQGAVTIGAGTGAAGAAGAAATAAGGIFSSIGGTIALITAGVVLTGGIAAATILPVAIGNAQTQNSAIEAPGTSTHQAPVPDSPRPSALPLPPTGETAVPLIPPTSQQRELPQPPQPSPVPPKPRPVPPPVEPTTPPVQPTAPPVEPTNPPVEPTEPPVDPSVPELPAGTPVLDSAKVVSLAGSRATLELQLSGQPDTQVDVLFFALGRPGPGAEAARDVRASGVLDAAGTLRIQLSVTYAEFISGSLRTQYVVAGAFGPLGAPISFLG